VAAFLGAQHAPLEFAASNGDQPLGTQQGIRRCKPWCGPRHHPAEENIHDRMDCLSAPAPNSARRHRKIRVQPECFLGSAGGELLDDLSKDWRGEAVQEEASDDRVVLPVRLAEFASAIAASR